MPAEDSKQTPSSLVVSASGNAPATGMALALSQNQSLVTAIDARIVAEENPQRLQFLAALRREIIDQDAVKAREQEKLQSKRRNFWFKTGFCGGSLALGAGLVAAGFAFPGFFVLGGGLALVAPQYVRDFLQQNNKQNDQPDE